MAATQRYRVVQWSTGNVGSRALPAIIDHPQLELVGVHAFGADKVGKDAGELAGRGVTGVITTSDVGQLIELAPDCVNYMPIEIDYDLVGEFLRAGINVVTTGDFLTGSHHVEKRAMLDAAGRQGGATFLGTGLEPGFVNLAAGFLTGTCRRVYSVSIVETFDCTTYPVAAVWKVMGFGRPVTERIVTLGPDASRYGVGYFETLDLIAEMIGIELDRKEAVVEAAGATQDLDLGFMRFAKGTVAGQRRTYRGYANGRSVVELTLCWTMSHDSLEPQWSDPEGFRIEIEGEPRVDATIKYTQPTIAGLSDESDTKSMLTVGTAMAAVHAIPHVCAAPPGVVQINELPIFGARYSVV
jgi:2,4-diaminopentanoate dehydrogenase